MLLMSSFYVYIRHNILRNRSYFILPKLSDEKVMENAYLFESYLFIYLFIYFHSEYAYILNFNNIYIHIGPSNCTYIKYVPLCLNAYNQYKLLLYICRWIWKTERWISQFLLIDTYLRTDVMCKHLLRLWYRC